MNKKEIEQAMKRYENQGFDIFQMEQIKWGLKAGVDVDKYADPKFDNFQMVQIKWGLEEGIDVDKYADPRFNWKQMQEIRLSLNPTGINKRETKK